MVSDIIKNTLFIGCGSFIGGAARYLISVAMKTMSKGFPWGTLVVNLVGCLAIGLLCGFFSKNSSESSSWALFMTVCICGGFTTFSTFSKEALVDRWSSIGSSWILSDQIDLYIWKFL